MFSKFKNWFIRFMQGRYGTDSLNKELLTAAFIAWAVSLLSSLFRLVILYYISDFIFLAASVYMLFRTLSRNIQARAAENRKFCVFKQKRDRYLKNLKMRLKDIKNARYRTCPHCKATVRLPIKRGKHTVKCPKCGERFDVRILF